MTLPVSPPGRNQPMPWPSRSSCQCRGYDDMRFGRGGDRLADSQAIRPGRLEAVLAHSVLDAEHAFYPSDLKQPHGNGLADLVV